MSEHSFLVVSHDVPRPDQTSGDLRFFKLLDLLARRGTVSFYSIDQTTDVERQAAERKLKDVGVTIRRGTFSHVMRERRFDVVMFELYFVARDLIDVARTWQPKARIVVDSVDVHFHRLGSKARLTGMAADAAHARAVRNDELTVYRRADLVVTVSDDDKRVIESQGVRCPVAVLPNIHEMAPLARSAVSGKLELIFIGSYKWAPNVDAMLYFCSAVMPLLRGRVPAVRLRIVGSGPTPEIQALAGDDIEVVGYVEDTAPFLASSHISVAPLRYGGGIKGKIGEAQAHGLPVVTTPVGAEGFGFEIGRDVLVADSALAFADAVVALWQDPSLYESVRRHGWDFIHSRYSIEAVSMKIPAFVDAVMDTKPKRVPTLKRLRTLAPHMYARHVAWRFR